MNTNRTDIKSKAICILGMHRSGTSTVSRAINLLGAYLGEDEDLMPATTDNPEGYWERTDVFKLQDRLLSQLKRSWDTSAPLPDQWHLAEEVRPFREELRGLIRNNLLGHALWAWKDPRTCILFPLWKSILDELGVELACVLTVRNPLDVANSLRKRDGIALDKSYGIWFNYTLAALQAIQGIPSALISYDRFLEDSETELRRCSQTLGISWPEDDQQLKELLGSFLRKELRHSRSETEALKNAPRPVQKLQALLAEALDQRAPFTSEFFQQAAELRQEFVEQAAFFRSDVENCSDEMKLRSGLEQQLHLKNHELGELYATLESHARQLAERDQQLAERIQQLAEHDLQLANQDLQSAKLDLQLTDMNQQLSETLHKLALRDQQAAEHVRVQAERDEQAVKQDELLTDLNRKVAQKEQQLAVSELRLSEKDLQIAKQDLQLTELNQQLSETRNNLASLNDQVSEQARLLSEQDLLSAKQDQLLSQLSQEVAEKSHELRLGELRLAEKDLHLAKQDLLLTEGEKLIKERDRILAEKDQQLIERDLQLIERDQRLSELSRRLEEERQHLLWRDQRLAEKDQQLAELDQQLSEHSQRVTEKRGHILWRDQRIAEKDQLLADRDQQLSEFARKLGEERGHVLWRDQRLAEQNRALTEKDRRIEELQNSLSWKLTAPLRSALAIPMFGITQAKIYYQTYHRFPTLKELPSLLRLASRSFRGAGEVNSVDAQGDAQTAPAFAPPPPMQPAVFDEPATVESPAVEPSAPDGFPPDESSFDDEPTIPLPLDTYEAWVQVNQWNAKREKRLRERLQETATTPLLSVIMPVYDPPVEYLNRAIETVRSQVYANWELCIADDASRNGEVRTALLKWAETDDRIKITFREKNGNISLATSSAVSLATGSHLVFLDQDDELTPDALGEIALYIAANPEAGIIYSDDDKIDTEGKRFAPQFKPDWSPELLLSYMYLSHVFVVSRELFQDVGGTRVGFEGSQDYDLALRVSEKARHVGHIPLVLYHWRVLPGSTASSGSAKPDSMEAGRKAVHEALARRGMQAVAYQPDWAVKLGAGFFSHRFTQVNPPSVTIIIPTKDQVDVLKRCVDSVLEKTDYPNYQILIIDNESADPKTIKYLNKISEKSNVRTIRVSNPEGKFNFAYINNRAAKSAASEYLLFLNNDTEVLNKEWLSQMVGYGQLMGVGAVGARLFYPDHRIQHAGVLIKFYQGMAGHAFKGLSEQDPGYLGYAKVVRNYSAVTAACLLTPKKLFLELGGFDDTDFKVAYNDVDYCGRLLDKGYRMVYTPEAVLTHHEGFSRGFCDDPRESVNFRSKYYGKPDRYYSPSLSLDNEHFEVRPRSMFTGEFTKTVKTLMCSHNLNHEGAPYSQYEMTVGLKEKGTIDPIVFSPADGPLRELYESHGIQVIIDGSLGCVFDPARYKERVKDFKAFIRSLGVDVVYANTLINFHVIDAARAAGLPSVWNIRESEPWQYYQNVWGAEMAEEVAKCFSYPYKVVFVAHTTKHGYSAFERRHNFHVIYNGLNLQRIFNEARKYSRKVSREEFGIQEGELAVLLPGTICERKGQHDLARAMGLLSHDCLKKIRCFVVGDWDSPHSYNRELHDLAQALPEEARNRLSILPITSEIFKFYNAADIFVCTSVVESFPRIILEAMAFNLPIVTTPVFGIREQVQEGVNALIYSPGDHHALAQALEKLIADDDLRQRFSDSSVYVLRQLETFDEMAEGYVTVFKEAYLSLGPKAQMPEGIDTHPRRPGTHGAKVRKVSFLTSYKDENSQRFRVYNLVQELNNVGVDCAIIKEDFTGSLQGVLDSDLLITFRVAASANVRRIIGAFKGAAIPTVFDVDDLVFEPESADLLHGLATLGETDRLNAVAGLERLRETLLLCDYGTCTTRALASRFERLGKSCSVIPNTINDLQLGLAQEIKKSKPASVGSKVKIGYFSGTRTHEKDFMEASDALYEVLVNNTEVEFHLVGILDLDPKFSAFGDRIVRQPLMDYLEMLRYLSGMDINLAPLEMNNVFTAGKSELKVFEAGLLGIPTVASAIDSYAGCISDGVNGFLASSKGEWIDKLEKLIKDASLRHRMAQQAKLDFTKRYHIKNVISDVVDIYQSFANAKKHLNPAKFLVIGDGLTADTLASLKGQVCSNWEVVSLADLIKRPASDDVILFAGHGVLPPFALYELTQYLKVAKADLFYTDEDTVSGSSFTNPHFKSDWSPDLFRNYDYITNFFGIRWDLLRTIVSWSSKYDLVLKASEITKYIIHIPKILFHVQEDITSIDESALAGHLKRIDLSGVIKEGLLKNSKKIEYLLRQTPKISIIIANKDHAEVLETCITSITEKSSYINFEIVVVENGSVEPETFAYYDKIAASPVIKIIKWAAPFNFSAVNNYAVHHATGEVLLFLNNDVEVISPDWLERMLEYAVRKDVGCVGAKLYYPDDTLQHGGVTVGLGGVAGHSHKDFKREADGYFGRLKLVQNLSAVTAACVMMRREIFDAVRGFDEGYPLAFNDIDLCLKIRKYNYLVVWTPFAELYHHESKSRGLDTTPEKQRRFQGEVSYFMERWSDFVLQGDPYYNINLTLKAEDFSLHCKTISSATKTGSLPELTGNIPNTLLKYCAANPGLTKPIFNYFLDKIASGMFSAEYLDVNYQDHQPVLTALANDPPGMVWLDSCSRVSSVSSYRIYRWLIQQNYQYYHSENSHFMIRDDIYHETGLPTLPEEEQMAGLRRIFHLEELLWLPTAWGKTPLSDETFEQSPCIPKLIQVNSIEMDADGWGKINCANDPHLIWNLNPPLDGGIYDFVKIDIECRPLHDAQFRSQIFWAGVDEGLHEDRTFTYTAHGASPLLIPVGSHPQWLRNSKINTIRLDIDNYKGEIKISSITFWSLVK